MLGLNCFEKNILKLTIRRMAFCAMLQKRKRSHGSAKEVATEQAMDVGQVAASDQDEEDDDEMLFVRGASPIMRSGYSPPSHGFHDEPFGYMESGELVSAVLCCGICHYSDRFMHF
jgi:hypothetical protein